MVYHGTCKKHLELFAGLVLWESDIIFLITVLSAHSDETEGPRDWAAEFIVPGAWFAFIPGGFVI